MFEVRTRALHHQEKTGESESGERCSLSPDFTDFGESGIPKPVLMEFMIYNLAGLPNHPSAP